MVERPGPRGRPRSRLLAQVRETVIVVGTALVLSLLIKTFLVQAFSIPSISMADTLQTGDRVLVSKLTPGPLDLHRGDVIVFKDPGGWLPQDESGGSSDGLLHYLTVALTFVGLLPHDAGEHLIKRVIGLPGDTVSCCDAQHRVQVNGVSIDESYVVGGALPSELAFKVEVQPGHLWVMGDNRSNSSDSRFHRGVNDGQVPIDLVIGKAFAVVWPISRFGGVTEPPDVFAQVPAPTAQTVRR